jgi:hypothetical protein
MTSASGSPSHSLSSSEVPLDLDGVIAGRLSMSRPWLSAAFPILVVLLFHTHTASGQSLFKVPCAISYNGSPPIETNCLVKSSMAHGLMVEMVQTPNGKTFVLANHKSDTGEWYLDHQRAAKVSDEPNPCYRNAVVQICF